MRIFKGYRTRILSILTAVAPILALSEWRDVIPDGYWPFYCLGVSILMLVMREFTTTPPGRK